MRHFCLHVRDVRATCASIWRISRRCMHILNSNFRFWLNSKISNIFLTFFGRKLLIFLHFGGKYKMKKQGFSKNTVRIKLSPNVHGGTESTQTFLVDVGKHLKFPERKKISTKSALKNFRATNSWNLPQNVRDEKFVSRCALQKSVYRWFGRDARAP